MNGKKMVAPVIITIILVAVLAGYICLIAFIPEIPLIFKVLGFVFYVAIALTIIGVLISRIKEIRSGEEDDLSKY